MINDHKNDIGNMTSFILTLVEHYSLLDEF